MGCDAIQSAVLAVLKKHMLQDLGKNTEMF